MAELQECLDDLPERLEQHRVFVATYRRTTAAVGAAAARGEFEDRAWVEHWDAAFARLYLSALRAEIAPDLRPSRPWRLAFTAPAELPPLRHILFGINAHVNYDLPQSLLAVITDSEFADPELVASRRRDHERIDAILAGRVSAEDDELGGRRSLQDRLLAPINRQPRGPSSGRPGERSGTTPSSSRRPASTVQTRTHVGWPSSNSSPRPRSRISGHPARSCFAWPSPASASHCLPRTERGL